MDYSLDNLRKLVEKLKTIGFFERLFAWSKIKSLLIDANGDIQKIAPSLENARAENAKIENQLSIEKNNIRNLQESIGQLKVDNESLKDAKLRLTQEKEEFQQRIAALDQKNENYFKRGLELKQQNENLVVQNHELQAENTKNKVTEDQRRKDYDASISNFNKLSEDQKREKNDEINERHRKDIERIKKLKETWSKHEENVKNRIKAICTRHGVDYVERVPFRGSPDNTLKIKDEYIIFDAKSPGGEDLSNFPTYLKNQVEQAIKYVKEEDVRKEVFLVIPTNTLEELEQFEFKLADYTVYIVSLDSLEPIIITLKKIEDYEFAEQLSPEERENICRVIGKFVHLSKRRIQIDGFFAKQFFELVYRSEADLSKEFLDKVVEFEKSEKLNPPIEKRSKQINIKELESDTEKLRMEANQKGILTQDSVLSKEINKLPLYSTEGKKSESKDQGKLFEKE